MIWIRHIMVVMSVPLDDRMSTLLYKLFIANLIDICKLVNFVQLHFNIILLEVEPFQAIVQFCLISRWTRTKYRATIDYAAVHVCICGIETNKYVLMTCYACPRSLEINSNCCFNMHCRGPLMHCKWLFLAAGYVRCTGMEIVLSTLGLLTRPVVYLLINNRSFT